MRVRTLRLASRVATWPGKSLLLSLLGTTELAFTTPVSMAFNSPTGGGGITIR